MTTGSNIDDFRKTVQTDSGQAKIGTYWSRVWDGRDQPSITKRSKPGFVLGLGPGRVIYNPPRRLKKEEHPYKMDLISFFDPAATVKYSPRGAEYTGSFGTFVGSCGFKSAWTSNDDIALLGKLREVVAGSTFNAGVFLAEGNQALHLVASAASALDGAYRHAKRGDFKSAGKSIAKYERSQGRGFKTVANNWLEFQYGVRPLLSDVYDAAQTVARLTGFPLQQTVTVTRKVIGSVETSAPSVFLVDGSGFEAVKIKAIIREVNIPQLLGLTDPASVAWEKLPYSFVVDWFVPIGSYLQARGLSQALTGTFVTSRTVRWSARNAHLNPKSGVPYTYTGLDQFRRREVHVTRTISTSLSVPVPSVKPLAKAASWQHAANAIALLTQLTKSR